MPIAAEKILTDTGPLVALLNSHDEHHVWARTVFATLVPPLFTCESVISEVQFLLCERGGNPLAVLDWVQLGVIQMAFDAQAEVTPLMALQKAYRALPMDFTDACLVRMSELHSPSRVLTVDSHFRIYRRNRRQVIPLLAPW